MGLFDAAMGGGSSDSGPNASGIGPLANGPVNISIAGFGSKASASGSAAATQTPASAFSASEGQPSWMLPAALLLGLVLVAFALKR